jgi:uncharacterized protein (TIGR03083 family)
MGAAKHYRSQRGRVTELVRELTPEQLETRVPGCPEWTVRELLSHLTALPADVDAGRLDGAGTPEWTAVQVAERHGRGVDDLLAEWEKYAPALEAQLDEWGDFGWVIVWDITLHEDDLREALGLPLGVGDTQAKVLEGLVARASKKVVEAGLPAVSLAAGARSWTLGEGEPVGSVAVSDEGELSRTLGGRRTDDELRALAWSVDPEPYLTPLRFRPGVR